MIIDKIENSHLYKNISERISKSFEYIKTTDLKNLPPGKYPIDGENIFALVSEYQTKAEHEGKLEAHRKYLDVQYVISGEELMGYTPLGNQQVLESYKEENDIVFYTGDKSFTKVSEGMFAIFFPKDVHMPGIASGKYSSVKKLVIKVRTT
ncbi:MAG: YhcH/YjgK/YiaL family protein [Ignavibacteriaceae bacterium]|jgi:YhcH/YjgK/YiaL family protein|nr:YhcH/YjgK/YiaL family protein [Ignavibacteriaceae bacterium]MCU0415102.1 YhcH/YjgK/YiaL family protein [Ignavibacteriaceae bacterium]